MVQASFALIGRWEQAPDVATSLACVARYLDLIRLTQFFAVPIEIFVLDVDGFCFIQFIAASACFNLLIQPLLDPG
jgi:hypothetical protein